MLLAINLYLIVIMALNIAVLQILRYDFSEGELILSISKKRQSHTTFYKQINVTSGLFCSGCNDAIPSLLERYKFHRVDIYLLLKKKCHLINLALNTLFSFCLPLLSVNLEFMIQSCLLCVAQIGTQPLENNSNSPDITKCLSRSFVIYLTVWLKFYLISIKFS